jgi:hypothetical protein
VEAVIASAGHRTLHAVMSSGVWRVRDARLVAPDPVAAARARDARRRSLAALSGD